MSGASVHDPTTFVASGHDDEVGEPYPTMEAIRYYVLASAPGGKFVTVGPGSEPVPVEDLRSQEFEVSHDGNWTWDGVTFPCDGTWTLRLRKSLDDSDVATHTLTVV